MTEQTPHIGGPGQALGEEEIRAFLQGQLDALDLQGKRVCVIVPDATRSLPTGLLLGAVHAALSRA